MGQIASNCLTIGNLLTGTPYRLRCRDEQTTQGVRPVEDNSYSDDFRSDEPEGIQSSRPISRRVVLSKVESQSQARRFLSRNIKDDDCAWLHVSGIFRCRGHCVYCLK
jgi:hypothetical protein